MRSLPSCTVVASDDALLHRTTRLTKSHEAVGTEGLNVSVVCANIPADTTT